MRATDSRFLDLLRGYLKEFLVADEHAGGQVYSADCGEERVLRGGKVMRAINNLYFGPLRIYRGPVREEMAARLISTVRDNVTSWRDEFVRIRAAGVATRGRVILLPSRPEPHLPALTALLVGLGGHYLGDEVIHFDPVLRQAHSLSLPLLLDAHDLVHFPELNRELPRPGQRAASDDFLRAITPRRAVPAADLGGNIAVPAPVGWIVFPYFEQGALTRLEPIPRSEALLRLSEAILNLDVWRERALILFREMFETVPVTRLVVGSLPDAARLVWESAPSMLVEKAGV